jgi:hypothetical protein
MAGSICNKSCHGFEARGSHLGAERRDCTSSSTLARVDNPRSRMFSVTLIKVKLYFRVNDIMRVFDRGRHLDLKGSRSQLSLSNFLR